MKKITVDMDMSDYDIAMDFYQSLMHFIINNKENDINVDSVIENLKFIYDTDLTAIEGLRAIANGYAIDASKFRDDPKDLI